MYCALFCLFNCCKKSYTIFLKGCYVLISNMDLLLQNIPLRRTQNKNLEPALKKIVCTIRSVCPELLSDIWRTEEEQETTWGGKEMGATYLRREKSRWVQCGTTWFLISCIHRTCFQMSSVTLVIHLLSIGVTFHY